MGRRKTIDDDKLLSYARESFIEKGIGVSTREIAHRAGISESVLFQRFNSKIDLFFAAMVPPSCDVSQIIAKAPESADVCAQLEEIMLAMLGYFQEIMDVMLLLVSHPSFSWDQFMARHPNAPVVILGSELAEFLTRQVESGKVALINVNAVVLNLLATAYSLAFFTKIGAHGGSFAESLVRDIVRSMWKGLQPRG